MMLPQELLACHAQLLHKRRPQANELPKLCLRKDFLLSLLTYDHPKTFVLHPYYFSSLQN